MWYIVLLQYVFNDGKMDLERLKHLVNLIGKDNLILDLSCRKKVYDFLQNWDFTDILINLRQFNNIECYWNKQRLVFIFRMVHNICWLIQWLFLTMIYLWALLEYYKLGSAEANFFPCFQPSCLIDFLFCFLLHKFAS